MNKIETMKSVKMPSLLPGINMATAKMVADFFGVSKQTITNHQKKYKEVFEYAGMRDVTTSELNDAGYIHSGANRYEKDGASVNIAYGSDGTTMFSEECFLFFAEHLRNNEVAEKIVEAINSAAEPSAENATGEEVEINDERFQVFSNPEFGDIRTIVMDGDPWFVGKDVCDILGYAAARNAVANHVDEEDKTTAPIQCAGSNYKSNAVLINESGLYSLILQSKLPAAKKFKRWVTSEVLPSIRKHGAYMTTETLMEAMKNPDYVTHLIETLHGEQQLRLKAEEKNAALEAENSILAKEDLTWGTREILNRIVRKTACWFFPDKSMATAVSMMWSSLYKEVLYKHHINLKGRLEKATPEELMNAVSVMVAKCRENGIGLQSIIGSVNYDKLVEAGVEV